MYKKSDLLSMKAVKHEVYHGDADQGLTAFRQFFVVFAQAPVSPKPSKGSFDDPAVRQEFETLHVVASFDNLQNPTAQLLRPLDQFSRIAAIGPNEFQAGEEPHEFCEQQFGAVAVLNIRRVDHDADQEPQGVHGQVALAAFYFLPRVIAANPFFSVVFTDWLSMIAALGLASRPASLRTSSRSRSWSFCHVPSLRKQRK